MDVFPARFSVLSFFPVGYMWNVPELSMSLLPGLPRVTGSFPAIWAGSPTLPWKSFSLKRCLRHCGAASVCLCKDRIQGLCFPWHSLLGLPLRINPKHLGFLFNTRPHFLSTYCVPHSVPSAVHVLSCWSLTQACDVNAAILTVLTRPLKCTESPAHGHLRSRGERKQTSCLPSTLRNHLLSWPYRPPYAMGSPPGSSDTHAAWASSRPAPVHV